MRSRLWAAVVSWVLLSALGAPASLAQPAVEEVTPEAAARAHAWRWKAMTYADRVEEPSLRGYVYLAMAHVLSDAGEIADACKAASQVDKPQTRVYAYSSAAKKCVELGDKEGALAVLAECRASLAGLDDKEREDGYHYLAQAYSDCGFWFEASGLTNEAWAGDLVREGMAVDMAKAGDMTSALQQASAMSPGRRLATIARCIEWELDDAKVEQALADVRPIESAADSNYGFGRLVKSLLKLKRLDEAAMFADRITDPQQRTQNRAEVAAEEAAGETPEEIRTRIAAVKLMEEKLPLYKLLVEKLIAADRLSDAEAAVEELVAVVEASPRPTEVATFGAVTDESRAAMARTLHAVIAAAYFKKGMQADYQRQVTLAANAAADMELKTGIAKIMTLWMVLRVQLMANDLDGALDTIERVKAAAQEETDGEQMSAFMVSSLAGEVAERLIERGDVEKGLEVATEIHGKTSGGAISDVAIALVRAGRIEDAKAQMERLVAEGDAAIAAMAADGEGEAPVRRGAVDSNQVRAFQEVAAAMAATGRDAELEAWLPEMPSDAMRAAACLGAAVPRAD